MAIPFPGKSPDDFRWFQFAALTFGASLMEIFVTLRRGGTLCSADRSVTLTGREGTVNKARATIMMATPSLAALLSPTRLTTLDFESLWTMGRSLTGPSSTTSTSVVLGGFSGRRLQVDEAGVKNMNSRVRNTVITGPRNFPLELRF